LQEGPCGIPLLAPKTLCVLEHQGTICSVRAFNNGTSVFGLFTVVSICVAAIQAYFWILVQSLYCRYDKEEMTREEAFKIKSYKLGGSGAIIRHHNPAFDGIINSAFIDEPDCNKNSSQVHKESHHQFNNGHFQPIFHTSDTETERSLGEVTIPMATFKTQATRKRISDDQILDASQLESV